MATISTIEQRVQDRLEETRGAPGVFWDLQYEIRPGIVEGLNEAVLITGSPEVRSIPVAPAPLFTPTQNTILQAAPSDSVAIVRIEGADGGVIKKCSAYDLDTLFPNWMNETGQAVKYWFPFGMKKFGIYPKLDVDVQLILTYVPLPVAVARPYAGTEAIPFQQEYLEAFEDYSAHVLRLKEGGADFQQSMAQYNRYLSKMEELSKFALRKGSIRFTFNSGPSNQVTPVEKK